MTRFSQDRSVSWREPIELEKKMWFFPHWMVRSISTYRARTPAPITSQAGCHQETTRSILRSAFIGRSSRFLMVPGRHQRWNACHRLIEPVAAIVDPRATASVPQSS
jgi:hypothetical protein